MNHHQPSAPVYSEHTPITDTSVDSDETTVGQTNSSPTDLLFAAHHEALQNDYRDAAGEVTDCRDIALGIWKALKSEGRRSRMVTVIGKDSQGNRVGLLPTPYKGRVEWAWHAICEEAGVVYDPILPKPTAMQAYLATAFHQEVEIEDRLPL